MKHEQIIIACDNSICFTCERGFEKLMVLWITAGSDGLFRNDQLPAQSNEIYQRCNILGLDMIFLLYLRATKNIRDFEHH